MDSISFPGFHRTPDSAVDAAPNPSATSYLSSRRLGRWMPPPNNYLAARTAAPDVAGGAGALDHLLHSKSRILRTKLEVLALEVQARFALWDRNLERIGGEKEQVEVLLEQSTRLARYHLLESSDVTRLRESVLQLNSQRRDEDIQCWRDVVLVMRDFLYAWEAHEQAKSRSIFINHAGTGTEEYL